MISATDIRHLRHASDYTETKRIKLALRSLREERDPFFLTRREIEPIFHWKLGNQYGRVARLLARNSDGAYRAITRATFEIQEADFYYECKVRVGLLRSLSGVDISVASAILALVEPNKYCPIDFRGWRVLFEEDKRSFSISNYQKYLAEIRRLAVELRWPTQEVDFAVWHKYEEHTKSVLR